MHSLYNALPNGADLVLFSRWLAQEDADLFSINYLHFGAPKVWYCVSPSNRAKFERMCQVRR